MANLTRGVLSIALGAIAGDGGPGTSLTTLGYTKKGTAKMAQADANITNLYAEENDQPVDSITTQGDITFSWTVMNPDTATLVTLFGGTASGTTPNKTWNMPASVVSQELTVKITPKKGMAVVFPRASVTAKLNGDFSSEDLFGVDVTIKALVPTKSGVGPVQFIE
ncbi:MULTISPECIES: hypothetical protein [unclassified Spirosoma]|uniref:hypothetical protein n=1 Tax=unclassified Spirosoma TaxID=2621999 RepID=UPI000964BC9E|nr:MULTISPECIES: hypothetical protein [unclassified Spirosoma]MBN8821273.1 hypothetical protein [Spirosoma sp.]OJW78062.1 MAG: hypothetical protein BGO59_29020 [Spirosoma sp. 48-14]